MSLTSNSDLFLAIFDAGINRIVRHIMRQRPSLFNYGTQLILENPHLLCEKIEIAPEVQSAANPLVKVMDPLPVIGTSFGLNYAIQLTNGEIDFHPGNIINLPQQFTPPLANQNLSVHFKFCAGTGCPMKDLRIDDYISTNIQDISIDKRIDRFPDRSPPKMIVLPTRKLECFCLELFSTASCKMTGIAGNQKISIKAEGIEIVDLKPEAIENSIECYSYLALNYGILPKIGESISNIAFRLINLPNNLGSLRLSGSTTVPNNPAIENDQIKAFINLDSINLNIVIPPTICSNNGGSGSGSGGGSGGSGTTSITRTTKSRIRTGTFDFNAAISKNTFSKIFSAVIQGFKFSCFNNDSSNFGTFSVRYLVNAHLEGGTIELKNTGTVQVNELDIKWDTLHLDLCADIPKVCVGGFCLIPIPFDGCAVYAPEICVFEDNPDFCIPLDLSNLLTSEITFSAQIKVFYGIGSGVPNRWQIVIVPTLPFDVDIIDIADTVGDLVENLIDFAINNLLSGLPQWAKDLLIAILGPVDDIIRFVLDIPDDVGEWLLDLLTDLGVFDSILDAFSGYLTNLIPPIEIEDPYPVLPQEGSLIPVKIPIEFMGIQINDKEMILQGDIGN